MIILFLSSFYLFFNTFFPLCTEEEGSKIKDTCGRIAFVLVGSCCVSNYMDISSCCISSFLQINKCCKYSVCYLSFCFFCFINLGRKHHLTFYVPEHHDMRYWGSLHQRTISCQIIIICCGIKICINFVILVFVISFCWSFYAN